ncbi:MAG: tetratricopeptide repeat protein [Longilinea sp.]|nr:tetratricopeptide repeat protein [Longilinea sp.]HQF61530.1 tetratricopeptide repeat protein [Anaerolineaceae bacterium]HQH84171.1 tetratricopeptide repeat protein [Anaerolineaceae bacterium]
MSANFILDVNEANFEYEVISFSQNTPVVAAFWAAWRQPAQELSALLERLAREAQGAFRLARVDADRNPNLTVRYGVRSLPTVKAFTQGQVVAEFVGLQPEGRVRDFLSSITPPSPFNLALERADGFYHLRQYDQAEKAYRRLLELQPGTPAALLGLARTLLRRGTAPEAFTILKDFPDSRQLVQAELLLPLAERLMDLQAGRLPAEADLDALFTRALQMAQRGNIYAALDGLIELLRQDKRYGSGRARQAALGLIELLGDDDPATRSYRNELASALF